MRHPRPPAARGHRAGAAEERGLIPARFVGSFPTAEFSLQPPRPEIAFTGRSNVGKSSLLNALAGRRNLARTSRTPGKTRAVNVFNLDDRAYFVDLPGYGYARVPRTLRQDLSRLLRAYFDTRHPAGVVWLLDLRRDPSPEDLAMGALLAQRALAVLVTLTKADKIPRGRRRQRVETILEALGLHPAPEHVLLTSARTGEGIPALRAAIERLLERYARRRSSRIAVPGSPGDAR